MTFFQFQIVFDAITLYTLIAFGWILYHQR